VPQLSRRAFVRATATAAGAAGVHPLRPGPAAAARGEGSVGEGDAQDWVRVHLVVIDGLRPDEVWQMPTVAQLATDGWYLPDSRAQMLAETTPNHVTMITGVRADRHGMPGNAVAGVAGDVGEEPRYLQADTVFTLAARQAPDLVTAAATSKSYIVAMSRHERADPGTDDADATNDPFIVPVSGAALDVEVGPDAVAFSRELDPDLLWMSLGDVDRSGHSDPTGNADGPTGAAPLFRTAVLQTADAQVRGLVSALQEEGRWANAVVLVTADHSMDWSLPGDTVSLTEQFEADPLLAGATAAAENGAAALYWLLAPAAPGAGAQLTRMREIALATPGVAEAWYTRPNPDDGGDVHWVGAARPDWALTGDRTGDLVVVVEDGRRVTEPSATSNPVPGNHGHVVTLPIPMVVGGGWDGLLANDAVPATPAAPAAPAPPDVRPPDQGQNIDIAPTIAWLLGLHPPPGGFDGRVLHEAFSRRPTPRVPVADVPSLPRHDRIAGGDRIATAIALSQAAFPDAVTGLVVATAGDSPDALAATPLAAALGGPVLLTPVDRLPDAVAAEITRLAPSTVAVVGGTSVVADAVLEAVRSLGVPDVVRLAGDTRYGTAAAIAQAIAARRSRTPDEPIPGAPTPAPDGEETPGPDVVLASGTGFADALAAGPLAARTGRVVLLTARDALPPETAEALTALAPARVLVAGGEAAVSVEVEAGLRAAHVVERLGGEDRYATAAALVERTIREGGLTDRAFLVSGASPADALAAGPAVAAVGGMLLPLAEGPLAASGAIADLLARRADALVRVTAVGGEGALATALADEVEERIAAIRSR
jgi:putative cell wall-binding protein